MSGWVFWAAALAAVVAVFLRIREAFGDLGADLWDDLRGRPRRSEGER